MDIKLDWRKTHNILGGATVVFLVGVGIKKLIETISNKEKNSFEKHRFDTEGFDSLGRDQRGYDRSGFDKDGFDIFGRDRDGYSKSGFARDGFSRTGYDRQGYGRDRYSELGIDRAGFSRQFYSEHIEQLQKHLSKAFRQMQSGEYRYALYDARVIMEESIKLIVQHEDGQEEMGDRLIENLKICEQKQLLDNEFIDKLHNARKICNLNGHEFGFDEHLSYKTTYFVIMQVKELLAITTNALACTVIQGGEQ